MKRLGVVVVAGMAAAAILGAAPAEAAREKIPLLLVGVANAVTVVDLGTINTPTLPPVSEGLAQGALNTMCEGVSGKEVRIESDGVTLALATTRVLANPSKDSTKVNQAGDYSGSLAAGGYFTYTGSCITGVVFKNRVPVKSFYQIFIDDEKVGTYSYRSLKRDGFRPLHTIDNEACGINTYLYPGQPERLLC